MDVKSHKKFQKNNFLAPWYYLPCSIHKPIIFVAFAKSIQAGFTPMRQMLQNNWYKFAQLHKITLLSSISFI